MQPIQNSWKRDLAGMDDGELVRLAQQGRKDAFSELTRRNYRMSLKMALSILRDRESAEDEVQNAWWKAYQHIGQFQVTAKFSTWMTRIVVNQCLMRLRREKRAQFFYLDDVRPGDERSQAELVGYEATPESRLGSSEVAAVLNLSLIHI